jgi:hypothetical protein
LPTSAIAGENGVFKCGGDKATGRAALDTPLSRGMTVMSGREAGYMRESFVG